MVVGEIQWEFQRADGTLFLKLVGGLIFKLNIYYVFSSVYITQKVIKNL